MTIQTDTIRPTAPPLLRRAARAAVLAALLLLLPATAFAADFLDVVDGYNDYDYDGDGVHEIRELSPLFADDAGESTPSHAGLLVVLVEERLLKALPGAAHSSDDVIAALDRYRKDLRADGYTPRTLTARLYDGAVHQDGKTVLALREVLRSLRASYPDLTGAVLVGNFPEAYLVRSILRRKADDHLLIRPEPVARRADLVLADLDGAWEDVYHQAGRELVEWSLLDPVPQPGNPDAWPCEGCAVTSSNFLRAEHAYEDFFWVRDDDFSLFVPPGTSGVIGIDMHEVDRGPELAADDRLLANPIARPEIAVSRINPYHVAVSPDPAFTDLDGKGYLDAAGNPQTVRTPQPVYWQRDAALERELLIEYFDRNHAYRAGNAGRPFRTAAVAYPEDDFSASALSRKLGWAADDFTTPVVRSDASLLTYAEWLQEPAVLKGIHTHASSRANLLGGGFTVDQLHDAVGPHIWHWTRQGQYLVPSLESTGNDAWLPLYMTLWRNHRQRSAGGVFYLHKGCDGNSPLEARTLSYVDRDYGWAQNGESLLFYAGGVAMLARAKDFNDHPNGFTEALGESPGTPFGAGWLAQFEVAASDAGLADWDIQRKRSYNWSLLGDWTLTLHPPMVDGGVRAFDGTWYTSGFSTPSQLLTVGTHRLDDFAGWEPRYIDAFAIPEHLEVRMFHGENGVGRYATVRGDLPDVDRFHYRQWINSVEVRGRTTGTATLYSGKSYSGARAVLPPGHYTYAQIRDTFGMTPTWTSSLKLDGVDVVVYERQTWWNNWRFFTSSTGDLGPSGWDDRIESIVVVPDGAYAVAYEHSWWRGELMVLEPGRYDLDDLQELGFDGWGISSLYVGPTLRIRAYRLPGFAGTPLVLDAESVGDLRDEGWNDVIRSIVVERR